MAPFITKSIIIERDSRQIGIVGVTTTFPSNWGKAKILPEVENVRAEVDKLVAQGIKIIIVLSHCGLAIDREIAMNGGQIDLIVGGHSHSFLFSGSTPPGPDTPVSEYPTIVKQSNNREVLIVQASAYTKYLGNITLHFDDEGEVVNYEGEPIFLAHGISQDAEVIEELKPWQNEIAKYKNKNLGRLRFELDALCYKKECGMGNIVTDSMVWSVSMDGFNNF
jgi:5'-nucleotidase